MKVIEHGKYYKKQYDKCSCGCKFKFNCLDIYLLDNKKVVFCPECREVIKIK